MLELVLLALTLGVVGYYTAETHKLRVQAKRQADLFERQIELTQSALRIESDRYSAELMERSQEVAPTFKLVQSDEKAGNLVATFIQLGGQITDVHIQKGDGDPASFEWKESWTPTHKQIVITLPDWTDQQLSKTGILISYTDELGLAHNQRYVLQFGQLVPAVN